MLLNVRIFDIVSLFLSLVLLLISNSPDTLRLYVWLKVCCISVCVPVFLFPSVSVSISFSVEYYLYFSLCFVAASIFRVSPTLFLSLPPPATYLTISITLLASWFLSPSTWLRRRSHLGLHTSFEIEPCPSCGLSQSRRSPVEMWKTSRSPGRLVQYVCTHVFTLSLSLSHTLRPSFLTVRGPFNWIPSMPKLLLLVAFWDS